MRRSHTMRSLGAPSAPVPRDTAGGTLIYCDNVNSGFAPLDEGDAGFVPAVVCNITLTFDQDYQRIYLSASIHGLRLITLNNPAVPVLAVNGAINGYFVTEGTSVDLTNATARYLVDPDHMDWTRTSIVMTKVLDLPAGTYQFRIVLNGANLGDIMYYESASIQAILGQVVDVQHCPPPGGGCS